MTNHARSNRIFATGLAGILSLLTLLTPLAASAADVPHAADETEASITLPITQIWTVNGDGADLSADYALTPETTSHQDGYDSNTAQAVQDGLITYQIGDQEPGESAFTMTGSETTTNVRFTWTSPGLYVFLLKGTNEARSYYTYDQGTYLIRVYVRSDGDSFITAENEDGDKVAQIVVDPGYNNPSENGGDGDGGNGDGGRRRPGDDTTPSVPPTPSTSPTNIINESGANGSGGTTTNTPGATPAGPTEISEYGDNGINSSGTNNDAGPSTGDASNMTLYGVLMIVAMAGLAIWIRRQRRV